MFLHLLNFPFFFFFFYFSFASSYISATCIILKYILKVSVGKMKAFVSSFSNYLTSREKGEKSDERRKITELLEVFAIEKFVSLVS